MTRTHRRGLAPLLILLFVVGVGLGACGSDDDGSDDGGVPPASEQTDEGEDEGSDTTAADDTSETTAADTETDPYTAAIQAQAEAVGVASFRTEGDTTILVMEDGSTADDLGPACELAQSLLPEGSAVSTDLAGEVAPCG